MRLVSFKHAGKLSVGYRQDNLIFDLARLDKKFPTDIISFLQGGTDLQSQIKTAVKKADGSAAISIDEIEFLPLISNAGKVICIGRNYAAHAKEGGAEPPTYPEIFYRGNTSLIGHEQPIIAPKCSDKLDYEAELVFVIGKEARHVTREDALDHIAGYSIFNDATIRDYQRKSSQWTIGKNFDGTGAFGPELVTADELPDGAKGLKIQSRLNGRVMQDASTKDFIFPVDDLIAKLSECMTLQIGDVVVTGTPAGVGSARPPRFFMKSGDICA